MKVWIIERDHEPMPGMVSYRDDRDGYATARAVLNYLQQDRKHFYDAVIYVRLESVSA